MKITPLLIRSFLSISAVALLMTGCAGTQTSGGGSSSSSSAPISSADVASGHYGDTLEACLSRVPSNSSDSQRMLAKLTCQRDEAGRQSIKAVPGN